MQRMALGNTLPIYEEALHNAPANVTASGIILFFGSNKENARAPLPPHPPTFSGNGREGEGAEGGRGSGKGGPGRSLYLGQFSYG